MASRSDSPKKSRVNSIGKKLFRRNSRSTADKPAEDSHKRGFDLDSIPLEAFGKLSCGTFDFPTSTAKLSMDVRWR